MPAITRILVVLTTATLMSACGAQSPPAMFADGCELQGDYLATCSHSLWAMQVIDDNDHIAAVVEIPAGTSAKWELNHSGDGIVWEFREGVPRVVDYLPYPANYGVVPSTVLPEELGGDGDPLDILILGEALPRGTVTRVRVIGVLRMLDEGERDDKLLAVEIGGPLDDIGSVEELDARWHGASAAIESWFVRYDGPGVVESLGYAGADEARALIDAGVGAYSLGMQ